jgi:hypothetical protein
MLENKDIWMDGGDVVTRLKSRKEILDAEEDKEKNKESAEEIDKELEEKLKFKSKRKVKETQE